MGKNADTVCPSAQRRRARQLPATPVPSRPRGAGAWRALEWPGWPGRGAGVQPATPPGCCRGAAEVCRVLPSGSTCPQPHVLTAYQRSTWSTLTLWSSSFFFQGSHFRMIFLLPFAFTYLLVGADLDENGPLLMRSNGPDENGRVF